MFVGAIPRPCVEQALRVVPPTPEVRLEQGIMAHFPQTKVHSNDVSLLSVAYGALATGAPVHYRFKGRLAFLEEAIAELGESPTARLGALSVAIRLGTYAGKNDHAKLHFNHYVQNAAAFVAIAREKAETYVARLQLEGFSACDFRKHAVQGVARGATIYAWPPTYKGGYERTYKLVNENTEWEGPEYGIFDPKDLGGWLDELDELEARYCVCADHRLDGREPAAGYWNAGGKKPIYLYASTPELSSIRKDATGRQPFKYTKVDPWALTANTKVALVRANGGQMNYLKDLFLARGIKHQTGMANFLVFLDGRLAGGFIYARSRFDPMEQLYLLSDFSVSRERRIAKLIAALATAEEAVSTVERQQLTRFRNVTTTVFTDKPVSMKYRGVFQLHKRGTGFLQYVAPPSRKSAQELYDQWFRRAPKNPDATPEST